VKQRVSLGKLLIYIALSIWALGTIYPFFWVIMNSFKDRRLIRSESFSMPLGDKFTIDNFVNALSRFNIFGAYRNSIVISGSVTIIVMLLAGLAAYGLGRYAFRGRKVFQALVIASMMFPAFSTVLPVFEMQVRWGIAGTSSLARSLLAVSLPQVAGNMSFAIIVLMGFIRGLPVDMEESAYLEGCNIFQIHFRIVMPLARPSFATVAIFTFLWSYNDLFTQFYYLRFPTQWTVTRLLQEISSDAGVNYGLMAASVVLVVVPVLVVYMLLQKNIIKGLTAGAIKG